MIGFCSPVFITKQNVNGSSEKKLKLYFPISHANGQDSMCSIMSINQPFTNHVLDTHPANCSMQANPCPVMGPHYRQWESDNMEPFTTGLAVHGY